MLLRAYPASYRQQRADEMVGTLLETTPPGRTWPPPRDIIALLLSGLRARSGQDQRFSTAASLRSAALLGCAVYLSFTAVNYATEGLIQIQHGRLHSAGLSYSLGFLWPPFVVALLILAAALLPWFASRQVVVLGAAVAAAATVIFLDMSAPIWPLFETPSSWRVLPILEVLGPLTALVLLSGRPQPPPRLWLGLPGLVIALAVPIQVAAVRSDRFPSADHYLWLVPIGLAVVWIGIDARPAVALALYFGLWLAQVLVNFREFATYLPLEWQPANLQGVSLSVAYPWYAGLWADSRTPIAAMVALTVVAMWRVRRQALL